MTSASMQNERHRALSTRKCFRQSLTVAVAAVSSSTPSTADVSTAQPTIISAEHKRSAARPRHMATRDAA